MDCRPLKGFGAFEETLRSGRRVTSGPLSLSAAAMADGALHDEDLFFGVAISKRIAPRAVQRNRVKRLLRESVRRHVGPRAEEIRAAGFSRLIFRWRQAPSSPMLLHLRDIEPHVEDAVVRLLQRYGVRGDT
jgi:ribonuclease P protein component